MRYTIRMNKLIFILIVLMAVPGSAHICDSVVRAVNTDQKSMVMGVTLNPAALNLWPENVYGMRIDGYVSWKEMQKGCLADVLHRADVEIQYLQADQLCTSRMVLHRKDEFVSGDAAAVYKIRDRNDSCVAPSTEQTATIQQCRATTCPYVGDSPTFADFQDNCVCKIFDDMIQFKDESPKYENFYDPALSFSKPEGIETPFSAP